MALPSRGTDGSGAATSAAAAAIALPFAGVEDENAVLLQANLLGRLPRLPVKFIAFSTSLSKTSRAPATAATLWSSWPHHDDDDLASPTQLSRQATMLENLPIRATLHRVKQKPGRYFPPLSYSESERQAIDARPALPQRRRRVVRRLPPPPSLASKLTDSHQLIASSYSAAGGWQRTAAGWSWVAARIYQLAQSPRAAAGAAASPASGCDGNIGVGGLPTAAHSAPAPALASVPDHAKHLAVKHAARSAAPPVVVVPAPADAEAHLIAGATKTLHRRIE